MDWYVVRLPETGGVGVVAESALDLHRDRGWIRCSDAIAEAEKDQVPLGDYTTDLDATPDVPAKSAPAKTKEQ